MYKELRRSSHDTLCSYPKPDQVFHRWQSKNYLPVFSNEENLSLSFLLCLITNNAQFLNLSLIINRCLTVILAVSALYSWDGIRFCKYTEQTRLHENHSTGWKGACRLFYHLCFHMCDVTKYLCDGTGWKKSTIPTIGLKWKTNANHRVFALVWSPLYSVNSILGKFLESARCFPFQRAMQVQYPIVNVLPVFFLFSPQEKNLPRWTQKCHTCWL